MGVATFIVALVLHAQAQRAHQLALRPIWPAHGTITSPFGRDGSRWHPGIDIGLLRSLTVRAAQPGVVEKVGYATGFEGYGNIVLIRAGRYEELYAHLSSYRVHPGEPVGEGQWLGEAGCTGSCTGTHLHFEVRLHGQAVSPFATVLRPLVRSPARPRLLLTGHRSFAGLIARLEGRARISRV
jgi:murein DD-endopeptidase MepM/ murein hydrolase activator NlpD